MVTRTHSETQNTKGANTLEKISQKVTTIVKQDGILWMDYNKKAQAFIVQYKDGELVPGKYPVFITSNDPIDTYFSNYTSNTGMTDFVGNRELEYVKYAKKEHSTKGAQVVLVEKKLLVDDLELNAELAGKKAVIGVQTDSKNLYSLEDGLVVPAIVDGKKLVDWVKVVNPTVSQKRKGDLKFIPLEMERLDWLNERYGFSIPSYTTRRNAVAFFNAVKAGSRVALAASSGKRVDFTPGMTFKETRYEKYRGLDNEEVEARVFVLNKADGEEFIIKYFPQDFEVSIEERVILNNIIDTKDEQSIGITQGKKRFVRPATDGIIYTDAAHAKTIGLNKTHQFRWSYVTKGLNLIKPGLKETLGADVVLFDGAVKGDPEEYFRKNIFEYFNLNDARETEEENSLFISRQFFGAVSLINSDILDDLGVGTREVLNKAFHFDDDALSLFVGLTNGEEVDGEKVMDTENLTATMYESNPDLFKSSATNKRKLMNLVSSSVGELLRGARLFSPNTSFKHMVVDPDTIVRYLSKGIIGVDAMEVKQIGIRRGQVIVSAKETREFKEGKRSVFYIEHKKAVLFRFPFLHHLEAQLVNDDEDDWMCYHIVEGKKVYDRQAAAHYHQVISEGYYQGLAIYSLWDMGPEGQSGADFDGDTTGYTTNPQIVDRFIKQPLFLDYSLLNGELVEGVPWKDDVVPPLEDVVSKEQIEKLAELGVTYNSGEFSYPEALIGNRELELILADAMGKLAGLTNAESHIGVFTNINTSIMEIELILQNLVKKIDALGDAAGHLAPAREIIQRELNGYQKLSFYMASAIRWEIDKAKHGGAFMKKMPWLSKMLDGVTDVEELHLLEKKYDISLERLFYGSVLETDGLLNNQLQGVGLKMPILSLDYAAKIAKPRVSSSIYKGTNEIKGAIYDDSPYGLISDELEAQIEGLFSQPVLESQDNFRVEAMQVIQMAEDAGIDTHLPSFNDARNQLNEGVPADTSPVHLLVKYREDFSKAKMPLNEIRNQLLARYEEKSGHKLYDNSKATLEWLSKKSKMSREEQDWVSKAVANFDMTLSYYEVLSEKMDSKMYGDYKYGAALVYAQLYMMTLRQNLSHKESNIRKQVKNMSENFVNKHGRHANDAELAQIKAYAEASVDEESESGFSSIQSLYPLGAVQFLQVMNGNKSISEKKAGRNVSVYLEAPAELTKRDVEIWKTLVGTQVTFEDGYLYGYKINEKDDLLRLDERTVNPSSKEVAHLPKNVQKLLMEMKFKRGAKNWMGDKQQGVLLHATPYKKSVKLWLSGVRTIA